MRKAIGPAVLGLLLAVSWASLSAESPPAWKPSGKVQLIVSLNSAADLEHLRQTNVFHYRRAQRIIAAADVICHPGAPESLKARFDGAPHCGALWMTSNPPKRVLSFDLDDVHYVALVKVTPVSTIGPGKLLKVDATER